MNASGFKPGSKTTSKPKRESKVTIQEKQVNLSKNKELNTSKMSSKPPKMNSSLANKINSGKSKLEKSTNKI